MKRYNEYLRDLIVCGRAKPGRIVSHHIEIEDAQEAYEKFDQRIDGYTKVLIRFSGRQGQVQVRQDLKLLSQSAYAKVVKCSIRESLGCLHFCREPIYSILSLRRLSGQR